MLTEGTGEENRHFASLSLQEPRTGSLLQSPRTAENERQAARANRVFFAGIAKYVIEPHKMERDRKDSSLRLVAARQRYSGTRQLTDLRGGEFDFHVGNDLWLCSVSVRARGALRPALRRAAVGENDSGLAFLVDAVFELVAGHRFELNGAGSGE